MSFQQQNIDLLLAEIKEKIGKPVNHRVVIATIESLGIRSKDTMADFGMPSLESLAAIVYEKLNSKEYSGIKNRKEKEVIKGEEHSIVVSNYLQVKAGLFSKYYPLGILHLLPIFVQIVTIVLFGYSLWTFIGFNQLQSTAVVLGVIFGMVASGGFVQVMGKQASFYWNYDDYYMVKQTINYLLKVGVYSLLLLFAGLFVINYFIHLYPFKVLLIIFIYAFLIGLLLLILAPLHTIKQRWVISLAVLVGTAVALLIKFKTNAHIYITHWTGISIAIVIAKIYIWSYFKYKVSKKENIERKPPKITTLIYQNYQYFLYGILIYVFIFIDRILAWSTNINEDLPFIIYYEKNYEIGMDLAILVFLLLAGALEYSIAAFTRFLDIGQKTTAYDSPKLFSKKLLKSYWQHVIILLMTGLAIFWLIYYIINGSWGYEAQFHEALDKVSVRVSLIGGLGYLFLAWAMLNTLYLFTLNQPTKAIKGLIIACLINLIIGMLLSRFIAYEYSVVGMLCGAIYFLAFTLKESIHFYKNLDYYYYASF